MAMTRRLVISAGGQILAIDQGTTGSTCIVFDERAALRHRSGALGRDRRPAAHTYALEASIFAHAGRVLGCLWGVRAGAAGPW
jgi:hypothetical protein